MYRKDYLTMNEYIILCRNPSTGNVLAIEDENNHIHVFKSYEEVDDFIELDHPLISAWEYQIVEIE